MTQVQKYEAMVAAGGFGQRYHEECGLAGPPKSLLMGVSRPLLLSTIEQVCAAGYGSILVLNNRPEWQSTIQSLLDPFPGVIVVEDFGYPSTFLLARSFAENMRERFLFLYGHAPRLAQEISRLGNLSGTTIVSGLAASSKRKLIRKSNVFIEPPYVVNRRSLLASSVLDWSAYFEEQEDECVVSALDGPPEPNTRTEIEGYLAHYSLVC
jgi:hypothetical protein